ncbi:hypothetical protein [Undibacterium luofuense]|mgnify:CR=1 FL=1|uniref:hypothetical protein n=1 Tax=Undibacterium luofuense TaxID=2828733 RepID=UPI0030EE42CA
MANTLLINNPLELTTILIRHHGIHRGLWSLVVNFRVQGINYQPDPQDLAAHPAALVAVDYVGIREVEVADALTVDAAAVNPAAG